MSAGGIGDAASMDEIDASFANLPLVRLSNNSLFEYRMNYPKRGTFIIINNRHFHPSTKMNERSETDKDADSLYSIFGKLGFDVVRYNNLTKHEMLTKMIEAGKKNHSDCDCFGVAVLSHGDQEVLFGTDSTIRIDNFVAPIKSCRTLVGKPKFFLFEASRGNELDSGMEVESDAIGETGRPSPAIPLEADILYAYSTAPGYFSWTDPSKGSWFVQALTQVLANPESLKLEFIQLLTRVSCAVAHQFESSNNSNPAMNRKKQVPSIVSMLTKDLYLRPKK